MLRSDDVVLGGIRLEHRRVVTVERDLQSELAHPAKGMLGEVIVEVDPCRRYRRTGEHDALIPATSHDLDALDDVIPVVDALTAKQVEARLDVPR